MSKETILYSSIASPLGAIFAAGTESFVTDISVGGAGFLRGLERRHWPGEVRLVEEYDAFSLLFSELERYFRGEALRFRTPVRPAIGTDFELRVWEVLTEIPWGETRSYGWVAGKVGLPGGARAVGQACGKNPLPIVIPCHRVLRSDGSLGGYSGGDGIKRFLLETEGVKPRAF